MSRTKRRAGSPSAYLIVATVLVAAIPGAYGQNATPAAEQSANPSSSGPTSGGANKGSPPAAAASADKTNGSPTSGTQADKSGKPPAVCFQLTGHCVEGSKTPPTKGGTASSSKDASSGQAPPHALNLTAPDVRTVVSEDELKEPLPSNEQVTEVQEDQTVSVKGETGVPPDVPGGFGAIWWAVNHPSQAWRVLAPAE